MEYSIDYLSFTVPTDAIGQMNNHLMGQLAESAVSEFLGVSIHALLDNQPFSVLRGRAPYSASWGRADGGVRFFGSPRLDHVLAEVSGTGCKTLRAHSRLDEVLRLVAPRASRVDLAVDILCPTKPHVFAAERAVERFTTITDWRSETGDTFYVGSMKSDRFARVYRFAEPHPRSHQLRVEHIFRRTAAKAFAKAILQDGYAASVRAAGDVYGWSHPQWQPEQVSAANISAHQVRKPERNTINWLYGAVTSSIVKALRNNELDLEDFFSHIRQSSHA